MTRLYASTLPGSDGNHAGDPPAPSKYRWILWITIAIFILLAFQCFLWAVTLKGSSFVLIAPGLVCTGKAVSMLRGVRGKQAEKN